MMADKVLEITVDVQKPHGRDPGVWLINTEWKTIDARSRASGERGDSSEEVDVKNNDREALVAKLCGDIALDQGIKEAELTVSHMKSSYSTDAAVRRAEERIRGLASERNPGLKVYIGWGPG